MQVTGETTNPEGSRIALYKFYAFAVVIIRNIAVVIIRNIVVVIIRNKDEWLYLHGKQLFVFYYQLLQGKNLLS